jgi:hypothetical protein
MTPEELHAAGYSLEYAAYGVHVFFLNPVDDVETVFTVQFNHSASSAESQRRGWEAAQVDLVKRRLDT